MENMILIDLETMNYSVEFGGIYEVGAIAVTNGIIVDKLHLGIVENKSLIQNGYGEGYKNISFNKKMINKFKDFIEQYQFPLVAHNASFDRKFLIHFNWIDEDYPFFDSIRAIKYKNSKLFSYSLSHLIDFLNISKVQNHTALDDAELLFNVLSEIKPDIWIPIGENKPRERNYTNKSNYKGYYKPLDSLKKEFEIVKDLFSEKNIVFTGKGPYVRNTLIELAKKCGATANSNSITKKTDILVVGEDCGKKLEKAKELGIEIISIDDFFEMVNRVEIELPEIAATKERNKNKSNNIPKKPSFTKKVTEEIIVSEKFKGQVISLFPMRQALTMKGSKIVEVHGGTALSTLRQNETTLLVYEPYAENFTTVERAKSKNIKTMTLGKFNRLILDLEKME